MRRPVGVLRIPGVERPAPEAAGGRSKDRTYKLDRAIPDRPSSNFACSRQFPLRVNASAWASQRLGRAVALAGLRPGSLKSPMWEIRHGAKRRAPTLHPCGGESDFNILATAKC